MPATRVSSMRWRTRIASRLSPAALARMTSASYADAAGVVGDPPTRSVNDWTNAARAALAVPDAIHREPGQVTMADASRSSATSAVSHIYEKYRNAPAGAARAASTHVF